MTGPARDGTGDDQGTVVVVEDDAHIADLVSMYLRRDGFRVLQASEGAMGLALAEREHPRMVILDVGLPGSMDGLEVCRRLDGRYPVLMLTARDSETDRVVGLELGADDYMSKPFSPRELVARVRAILRRTGGRPAGRGSEQGGRTLRLEVGDLEVDTGRHEARIAGTLVPLTTREFALLAHLVANQGLVLSRRQLLDSVWGATWVGDERTVDVHVAQLRKKFGDALPLSTVWGVGYRLG
jgi:DNA-binding response OmpR family regulator